MICLLLFPESNPISTPPANPLPATALEVPSLDGCKPVHPALINPFVVKLVKPVGGSIFFPNIKYELDTIFFPSTFTVKLFL